MAMHDLALEPWSIDTRDYSVATLMDLGSSEWKAYEDA